MMEQFRKDLLTAANDALQESIRAKQAAGQAAMELILEMADVISRSFRGNHKLYLFGNGGSAADAQHIAAELVNRFQLERPPLPAIALTVDTSIITSISNDFEFDEVFLRQLQALAQPGDVALGISTSGRSPNVSKGLRWAREHGIHTLGWAGDAETDMDVYCDLILHVPSNVTARIQECHITFAHIMCMMIEELLFGALGKSDK